jgi:beta-lactamase superfamily II metal-dependent hydrolase
VGTRQNFLVFSWFRTAVCGLLCATVLIWAAAGQAVYYHLAGTGNTFIYKKGNLAVHFVDVGHGDCTIIQFPDGKTAVIDAGEDSVYNPQWKRVKKYINTRIKPKNKYFDYVINTHPDADHLDGLKHIMREYKFGVFIQPANFAEHTAIDGEGWHIELHVAEPTISTGLNIGDFNYSYENEMSPIITLEYLSTVFVITGDAGHPTENKFIASTTAQRIFNAENYGKITTYLQVGHHGSKNSTNEQFVGFLRPTYAIVPTSLTNNYGHPNPIAMGNLENADVITYVTGADGNFVVQIDGENVRHYFGFDNPPNYTAIWLVMLLSIILLSYISWYQTQNTLYKVLKKC